VSGGCEKEPVGLLRMLCRGLLRRCPKCGRGKLYSGLYRLRPACVDCGFDLERRALDTWAVVYLTTAGLTGVVVVGMLLLRPLNLLVGRFALVVIAILVIVCSLPSRKGMAIAFNYFIELRSLHADEGSGPPSAVAPGDDDH
jgi:uncharacterized protein (DUF983 family)